MRNLHTYAVAGVVAAIGGGAVHAAEHTITMAGGDYAPARIEARVGDVLTFVNDDVSNHNVFSPTAAHAVDLGRQEPGQTKALPLGQAGTMEVECVIHPSMLLTVTIAP